MLQNEYDLFCNIRIVYYGSRTPIVAIFFERVQMPKASGRVEKRGNFYAFGYYLRFGHRRF